MEFTRAAHPHPHFICSNQTPIRCSYFASDGFSYGSSISNWQRMNDDMVQSNKVFIPSVAPVRVAGALRCTLPAADALSCRATTTPKFGRGTVSGAEIGRKGLTTTPCEQVFGIMRGTRLMKEFSCRWAAALSLQPTPSSITITSWNEWGEGTQIEPAAAVLLLQHLHAL
jgi:hypothetical protein